jgi:hypothetical protein
MKISNWFYIGICTFSLVLGLLIGASQTPVVGVFITGIVGLIVTAVGIFYNNRDTSVEKISNVKDYKGLGKTLFFFSLLLIIGAYLGVQYRAGLYKQKGNFIWTNENPPSSVYEALDWIRVNEILKEKGYSENQIRQLYDIAHLKNQDSNSLKFDYYDAEYPYYKVLIDNSDKNVFRPDLPDILKPIDSIPER